MGKRKQEVRETITYCCSVDDVALFHTSQIVGKYMPNEYSFLAFLQPPGHAGCEYTHYSIKCVLL